MCDMVYVHYCTFIIIVFMHIQILYPTPLVDYQLPVLKLKGVCIGNDVTQAVCVCMRACVCGVYREVAI